MGEQRNKKVSEEEVLKQAEEQLKVLKDAKDKSKKTANEIEKSTAESASAPDGASAGKEKQSKTRKITKKIKTRGKKYQEAKKLIDANKFYEISEAISLAQKSSYTKFDASIEAHLRLLGKKTGKIEPIRGLIEFPHFTGKQIKAAIIDEALSEKILKDKGTDFDVLLATPEMMPKIGRLAKILGPRGLMPNPKAGTVTTNPKETMEKIKSGRMEYKSDKNGIIHIMIGKVSFDKQKLIDNYQAILGKIGVNKLQSIYICATMGPAIKISL